MVKKKIFSQFSILVIGLMFIFVPLNGMAQEIKSGGSMVVALPDALETLIPSTSYRLTNLMFTAVMFEGLVCYDWEGKMVPELAHSWKLSPDGLTWTFYLRKGVKWHDGKDFT
jgi:peptide/nickel transport system substrate-binding protein